MSEMREKTVPHTAKERKKDGESAMLRASQDDRKNERKTRESETMRKQEHERE